MGGVAKLGKEPSCELWWGVFLLNIPPPGKVGWIYDIWKLLAAASTVHTFHLLLYPSIFLLSFVHPPPPPTLLPAFFPLSFLSVVQYLCHYFFCPLFSIPFIVSDPPSLLPSLLCTLSSLLSYSILPSTQPSLVHCTTTALPPPPHPKKRLMSSHPHNPFSTSLLSCPVRFSLSSLLFLSFCFSSLFFSSLFLKKNLFRPSFLQNNLSTNVIFSVLYDFQPIVCRLGSLCLMVAPVILVGHSL